MGLKNIHHAMNAHLCVLLVPDFQVEVQLDSNKHKQKSAVKRALFLDSQHPLLQKRVVVRHGERVCSNTKIYLRVRPLLTLIVYRVSQTLIKTMKISFSFTSQNIGALFAPMPPSKTCVFFLMQDEKEFRDKLSPIYVALNISLDPKAPADSHGLRPILNYQTANVIEQKVL